MYDKFFGVHVTPDGSEAKDFDESEHPRADDGKFSSSGGSTSSSKPKKLYPAKYVSVEDNQYVGSTGKKPSGHGMWNFHIEHSGSKEPVEFIHTGLYSDAKKAAKREASKYKNPVVKVRG